MDKMTTQLLDKDPQQRNADDTLRIAGAVMDPNISTAHVQDIYSRWAVGYDSVRKLIV
jgi:hypothetical protein